MSEVCSEECLEITLGYDYNYTHILENQCVLPVITAAEPDILPFLKTSNSSIFECPLYSSPMIVQHPEEGAAQFVHPSQRNLGYYRCSVDYLNGTEDTLATFDDEIDIDSPVYTVKCTDKDGKTIYHDVYSNLKPFKTPLRYSTANSQGVEKPSVLMILIDGITGNSFQREMTITKEFLERRNAAFMKGFNRHSVHSSKNIFAMLTGKVFEPAKNDLNTTMPDLMQLSKSRLQNSSTAGWIFESARNAGYITHFNDDSDFLKKFDGMNSEVELPVDVSLR
ncbi:unnamed protein product [Bursaphelenchus xylophilus]|nr:unnamed protein product [Bursaphelenchus xylophilus]CAG9125328.1 unnamed protein product [Bursaphelenchus xylophilus]